MVTTHNLGFPTNTLKPEKAESIWQHQAESDLVSVACGTAKDPMVYMMDVLGHRSGFRHFKAYSEAEWFGSQAKYVVPEFTQSSRFSLNAVTLLNEVKQAKQLGLNVKPVIIGPISYLWFGEVKDDVNKLELLEPLLEVYADLLDTLADAGIDWVQLDEPILSQEIDEDWKHALLQAYFHLQRSPVKKLVASYFGKIGDNLGLLRELTVDGVHIDTISADDEALKVTDWLPNYKIISVAVIEGSQQIETDIVDTLAWLKPIYEILGDRLWLAPSCSLTHLAKDDNAEVVRENAKKKLTEVKELADRLDQDKSNTELQEKKVAA